jgi:hypothetical protein
MAFSAKSRKVKVFKFLPVGHLLPELFGFARFPLLAPGFNGGQYLGHFPFALILQICVRVKVVLIPLTQPPILYSPGLTFVASKPENLLATSSESKVIYSLTPYQFIVPASKKNPTALL